MFAIIVLGFLGYNLMLASCSTPSNFYEILGTTLSTDADTLKYAFHSSAKRNHLDRMGRQGEELFIVVCDAFEALKDPTTCFAHQVFVFLSVALSHVVQVFFPDDMSLIRPEDPRMYAPLVECLVGISSLIDQEGMFLHASIYLFSA